jgi:hypothetical protein
MSQPLKPIGVLGLALAMLLVAATVPVMPAARAAPAAAPVAAAKVVTVALEPALEPGPAPRLAPLAVVERPAPPRAAPSLPAPPRDVVFSPAPPTALAPQPHVVPVPRRTLSDVLGREEVAFSPLLRFRASHEEPRVAVPDAEMPDVAALLALPEGPRVAVVGSSVPEPHMPLSNSWVRSDEAPSLASLADRDRQVRTFQLGLLSWHDPALPDEFDPDALKAGIGVKEHDEVEVRVGLYPDFPDDAYQVGDHMLDTEDFSQTRAFLRAAWDW